MMDVGPTQCACVVQTSLVPTQGTEQHPRVVGPTLEAALAQRAELGWRKSRSGRGEGGTGWRVSGLAGPRRGVELGWHMPALPILPPPRPYLPTSSSPLPHPVNPSLPSPTSELDLLLWWMFFSSVRCVCVCKGSGMPTSMPATSIVAKHFTALLQQHKLVSLCSASGSRSQLWANQRSTEPRIHRCAWLTSNMLFLT